jgi:hypothetical protein
MFHLAISLCGLICSLMTRLISSLVNSLMTGLISSIICLLSVISFANSTGNTGVNSFSSNTSINSGADTNSSSSGNYESAANEEQVASSYSQFYQKRYPLGDTSIKLVDNHGDGFTDLYGVRNFRAVLKGVLYRGGANNAFNKNKVRDNKNPLPSEGLVNLCKEGFRNVFYMYTTNYDKKSNPVKCKTERGPDTKLENNMKYIQKGPWDRAAQHEILKTIYDNINNPTAGPTYLHCWNGWHASGLISSFSLRQFCNYTGDQAVKYWDQNTDGNNKGKAYESYRSQIRNFETFSDLKLTTEVMKQICFTP